VDRCNEALLAKAAEAKLLRTSRLRADTTVVPADVAYPTDSGLLAKAVRRIATTGRRVQAAGGATRTRIRDRSRAAGARAREIGAKLRLRARRAATRPRPWSSESRETGRVGRACRGRCGELTGQTPDEDCVVPIVQPAKDRLSGNRIRPRDVGGAGCAERLMT
jgi:hypothetical protein